ncbi:MAG: hypothetical protein U0263_12705 [Polyangiaceae bacterium]
MQFGYRFSNDYAVFLFCLLAGRPSPRTRVLERCVWSVAVNAPGAATFQRPQFAKYYFQEGTQSVLHQPD